MLSFHTALMIDRYWVFYVQSTEKSQIISGRNNMYATTSKSNSQSLLEIGEVSEK